MSAKRVSKFGTGNAIDGCYVMLCAYFDPSLFCHCSDMIVRRMELYRNGTGEAPMSKEYKPGENTGKDGGIFREVGPRGGERDN
jgi:hypothetical protein